MSATFTKAYFKKDYSQLITQGKNCILLISVGQRYHEGEKLRSTIQLINQSQFSYCHIVVADTLQRHNTNMDYNTSLKTGEEWLSRNKYFIETLSIDYKIIRWDDCLSAREYTTFKQLITNAYNQNSDYTQAIHNTISYFLERNKTKVSNFNEKVEFASCLTYLLEECPVIMPMWAAYGYDFIIYPKPQTDAMYSTYKLFVEKTYQGKAKWLALRFKQKYLKDEA